MGELMAQLWKVGAIAGVLPCAHEDHGVHSPGLGWGEVAVRDTLDLHAVHDMDQRGLRKSARQWRQPGSVLLEEDDVWGGYAARRQ